MNDRYESLQTPDLENISAVPLSPVCGDFISFSERDLIIDSFISTSFSSASNNNSDYTPPNMHEQQQQQQIQQPIPIRPSAIQPIPIRPSAMQARVSSTSSISSQQTKEPINVQIEGNIGAGKTRFMYYLQHGAFANKIDFVDEPISKWINCHGVNLLEQFYQHPSETNSASFHYYVMLTLLQNHLRPSTKPMKIMERSIHSCMLFLEIQHQNASISNVNFNILKEYYATFCTLSTKPDIVIYMDSSVIQCKHNIDVRNRPGETVSTDYLEQIDNIHHQWIIDLIRFKQKVIVIHNAIDLADAEAFLIKYIEEGFTSNTKQLRNGCLYNFEEEPEDLAASPSSPKWIKCDSCHIIQQQLE